MGEISRPEPVKLFVGIISSSRELIESTIANSEKSWGKPDLYSELISFDFTDYYSPEMGKNLLRQWVSFEALIDPGKIAAIKNETNNIEDASSLSGKRRINLDPGYLDLPKIVLCSTKDFSHRIYLSDGIYGEITLLYKGKEYTSLPWTYRDYQSDTAKKFFEKVRSKYYDQIMK